MEQRLENYILLIRSKNPIRCLEHNTNLSLYCETEQKLLCANCIFGRQDHKFHRVVPIDRSLDKIERDIEAMSRLIDRETTAMKATNAKIMQQLIEEENEAQRELTSLVTQYEKCHRDLEMCFTVSKNKIIQKM